ncbi:MAG: alpha/beta hydrolase, partial [Agathobaculum butyriciproducens]
MKEVLRLDHGVLTHFPASAGRNKPALILCPGGGYEYCSIREGAPVARAFARDGVEAFVLEYDCTEVPLGVKPLHTLSASVAWVREHAAQLGIAADRIAVGGFSAGAHLAGLLAATWHDADWFPAGTDLQAHRPNAAVLCYPVVSAGAYAHRGSFVCLAGENAAEQRRFSLETLVSARMPRTFLWHTLTDATVPVENTLLL